MTWIGHYFFKKMQSQIPIKLHLSQECVKLYCQIKSPNLEQCKIEPISLQNNFLLFSLISKSERQSQNVFMLNTIDNNFKIFKAFTSYRQSHSILNLSLSPKKDILTLLLQKQDSQQKVLAFFDITDKNNHVFHSCELKATDKVNFQWLDNRTLILLTEFGIHLFQNFEKQINSIFKEIQKGDEFFPKCIIFNETTNIEDSYFFIIYEKKNVQILTIFNCEVLKAN